MTDKGVMGKVAYACVVLDAVQAPATKTNEWSGWWMWLVNVARVVARLAEEEEEEEQSLYTTASCREPC